MASLLSTLSLVCVSTALTFVVYRFFRSDSNVRPLPPGPKGLPLIGNIHDFPKTGEVEYQHWLKHKDIYGPISSVTIFGQTFVIVNDANMALELLRDRSNTNSGRPQQTFSMDMVGWKDALAFLQPSQNFRFHRKNFAKVASSGAAQADFARIQEEESVHFLKNVLDEPQNLLDHIRKEVGAVMLRTTYGYTPAHKGHDPLVALAERALREFADSSTPGRYLVDIIPQLRYLPDWFPGTSFKQVAKKMKDTCIKTTEIPYRFVEEQMQQDKHKTSFLSTAIQESKLTPSMKHINKWSALSIFAGGADTTVSSIRTFFLAMMLHPEVQEKAREELDRVTGGTRLPVAADKQKVPYTSALVSEVLRWVPVAAMALPHTSKKNQIYNGYTIPKGAVIIPNSWYAIILGFCTQLSAIRWFLHDPSVYTSPHTFRPDRFLRTHTHTNEPDPRLYSFGYGRRICPGRALAEETLFTTIAQTLTVFIISKPETNDRIIEPTIEVEPGVISHLKPYAVKISPRSRQHHEMIQEAVNMFPLGESDAEHLNGFL